MYSQPLADAIAEGRGPRRCPPFIESDADLFEGLQYLAGCISPPARTWPSTTTAITPFPAGPGLH